MYTVFLLLSIWHDAERRYTRKSTTYCSDSLPDIQVLRESPRIFDVGIRDNRTGHWLS